MNTFRYTHTGVTYVYIGLILIAITILIIPLSMLLHAAPLLLALPLLWIASSLLSMIGRILCLSVPKEVGASGLIYAAVICDVSSLFAAVSPMATWLPNLSAYQGLLSVAAMVLFILFLKKLAVFISDAESAILASNMLILSIGLAILMVAMIALPFVAPAAALGPVLLIPILLIVGFFIYGRLLSGLRMSLAIA